MTDLAVLGLEIQSASVRTATEDLSNFAAVGKRTGETAEQVRDRFAALNVAAKPVSQQLQQLNPVVERLNRSWDVQRSTLRLLAREANLVGGPLGDMIRSFGTLSMGGTRLGVGLTAGTLAIAATAAAATKAVAAYADLEAQQAKIANALQATHGASGQTPFSLETIAKGLASTGTQSITDIRAAELELLKFKSIGGDAFENVLKVAKDLSAGLGGDLKSSVIAVAKALKDPANAADALADVSIKLSVAEQRLAKDFMASGDVARAQEVIWKALSVTRGADANSADTLGAAWQRLQTSGTSLLEIWGKQISEGLRLKQILDGIAKSANDSANAKYPGRDAATSLLKFIPGAGPIMAAGVQAGQSIAGGVRSVDAVLNGTSKSETVAEWERAGAAARKSIADQDEAARQQIIRQDEAKEKIAKVTEELRRQGLTAGMSAVQTQAYTAAVQAGVLGNRAQEESLRRVIAAQAARNDTRTAVDSIRAQAGAQKIEADSIGMSTQAAAAYKVVQEAILQGRIKDAPLGQEQIKRLTEEARAYEMAATSAAKLKLQQDTAFDRSQIGRSDTEQAVASRLRQTYGPGYEDQMNSAEAAQIRLNDQLKIGKDLTFDFASGLSRDLNAGVSRTDALTNAFGRLRDKLIDMALNKSISSLFGNLTGGLGGGVGVASSNPYDVNNGFVPNINGGGTLPGGFPTGHTGGMGYELANKKWVHPAYFENAPRFHTGRLAPGEMPAIIKQEESVLTPGQMRAIAGSAPKLTVNLIEDSSKAGQVNQPQSDNSGGFSIDIFVDKITAKNISRPGSETYNTLSGSGVRPPVVRR
jgi:hypothetical protein